MLDDDTFKQQATRWPELQPLRELRATLGRMRLTGLSVGADGRNRCSLLPFASTTGRNQPSNTEFVFGPARWMRGLIRPREGWGIAYVDYAAQEIAIEAALSGDQRLADAYASDDPYLAFARDARLVSADATRETHGKIRDCCKEVMLGVGFGMGPDAMAFKLGVTPIEARELLQLHRRAYPRFWRWMDQVVSSAMLTNEMTSVFGWRRHVGRRPKIPSLMNFPIQWAGAEMMRIAAIAATEAGIEVVAPVHDAFMVTAPLDRLDHDVDRMRALMARAGWAVTGGLEVRTDVKLVRWPDRYMSEGGEAMWQRVIEVETEALHRPKARHAGRFLKGPIPLRVIAAASRLPGRALAVLLAIHHQTALTRNPVVTLPKRLLAQLGVTKHGKARALHALETAGLVRVERQLGRSPKIRLTT